MSVQKGLNTSVQLAMDAHGMPLRAVSTEGTRSDCAEAGRLIHGLRIERPLANKGYDSEGLKAKAENQGGNRARPRGHDKALYKPRNTVESAFIRLTWRSRGCTRYAKNPSPFVADLRIRCLALRLAIS